MATCHDEFVAFFIRFTLFPINSIDAEGLTQTTQQAYLEPVRII